MKPVVAILFVILLCPLTNFLAARQPFSPIRFDFCGDPVQFNFDKKQLQVPVSLSRESIATFYDQLNAAGGEQVIASLRSYKQTFKPDDWLFYQLIRQTAQHISPKADDYTKYTIVKWYLLSRSGYDAIMTVSENRILFYVRCDENIYNIPNRTWRSKQYVCLNYHDYGKVDFEKDKFADVTVPVAEAENSFSYKIKKLPAFKASDYLEKDLRFSYNENDYQFKVKLNPQIQTLFKNYPTVDYESYLNIPLSQETYRSLIPLLRKNIKRLSVKNGVDYLMRFTRYAFLFQPDSENFGAEKRLSPEQTLLYEQSDCEDRVALFFYLVKELYDLPMIVLSYPKHVTIAVQFDKPVGKPIMYNGNAYYICEPTPQKQDLKLGQLLPELRTSVYEIAYAYSPAHGPRRP